MRIGNRDYAIPLAIEMPKRHGGVVALLPILSPIEFEEFQYSCKGVACL